MTSSLLARDEKTKSHEEPSLSLPGRTNWP